MTLKYITENKNSYSIYRNSRNYGNFKTKEDAIFVRDLLVSHDWMLYAIPEIIRTPDKYIAVKVIDDKVYILLKSTRKPDGKTIEKLTKQKIRNPHGSVYGLNITRVFDTFVVKKQIAGDDYVFGYYDELCDAEFVRNFLLSHSWNVGEFSQIEYDEDTDSYKIIEVIDDKVYVIDTIGDKDEIDLEKSHRKFLTKISKHKFGLAVYPHLDELKDKISLLEDRFNVKAGDENWNFEDAKDGLKDIVFNLTPYQKIVYDAVDGESTFSEIKKSLSRFQSPNYEEKIQKSLDELIGMNLIEKNQDMYKKK